jgi:hypothetical protein
MDADARWMDERIWYTCFGWEERQSRSISIFDIPQKRSLGVVTFEAKMLMHGWMLDDDAKESICR